MQIQISFGSVEVQIRIEKFPQIEVYLFSSRIIFGLWVQKAAERVLDWGKEKLQVLVLSKDLDANAHM
jgi:hypothetical protein